ncbi:MAG: hypothetical protein H0W39_01115 [Sphingomonas sp.]|nr:hypothetical protein [Sphingomonas sp.]
MATKSNGEPFVDTINFGTHYCAMWRWDDTERWTILSDKNRCRMMFPTMMTAFSEAMRIKMAEKPIRAIKIDPEPDDHGFRAWRAGKDREAQEERRNVFGACDRPKLVFCNGKVVAVETRRIRA